MIQCCRKNCSKWRYCDDYHDPIDVPKIWYCKMNSDKTIASCHVPEVLNSKEIEEDLIENKYNAGSIVWAHIFGYPWWPAIVDDCPNTLQYYKLCEPSIIPVKYHVTFFEIEKLQHAWVNCRNIKAFKKYKKDTLVKRTVFCNMDYRKELEGAYLLAQNALHLSITERLQKFSYVSRFIRINRDTLGLTEIQNDNSTMNCDRKEEVLDCSNQSSTLDEIIPPTPSNYITLGEFRKNRIKKEITE